MDEFDHVIQPAKYHLEEDIPLKGNWNKDFFNNKNPIVLELGCGKGEYCISLAEKYPEKNFIGVDIKGSRMYKGASEAFEKKMKNVGFLRIMIENIERCFAQEEIDEIWITFPDPQLKRKRESKRLTHPDFLNRYRTILSKGSLLHLKTDSYFLYGYTLGILAGDGYEIIDATHDVYNSHKMREDIDIKTHYEKMFLEKEMPITYIRFRIKS